MSPLRIRLDLGDDHKKQLATLLDNLGRPERMKMIETYVNKIPDATTEGLPAILLSMTSAAVPDLCALLANLEAPAHQAIVAEALETLAKDQSDHVLRGLSDRRPRYGKNLLTSLLKWNNPRCADAVEMLMRYPDIQVRKEVVRAIGIFHPYGNGMKLVAFLNDTEESVRMAAASFEHRLNPGLIRISETYRALDTLTLRPYSHDHRLLRRHDLLPCLSSGTPAPSKVLNMMLSKSGKACDAVLLTLFLNCVGIIPIGSLLMLKTSELVVMLRPAADKANAEPPFVTIITDPRGNTVDHGREVDLTEKDETGDYRHNMIRLIDNTEYTFDTSRSCV